MKPRRELALKDILDQAQLKQVHSILSKAKDPTSTKTIKLLRDYLSTQRESLLAKGVLPEYLAYAIAYKASQINRKR